MSLITITVPVGQERLKQEVVTEDRECQFEHFEEFDEDDFVDSDMEGSIINRPRPKKAHTAPVLPMRSNKRASMALDTLMPDIQSLDGSIHKDLQPEEANPHDLYLSSEEDASLSDYDDEDFLSDFEASPIEESAQLSPPGSRGSGRRSQNDTARIVSFIVVKPQIVDIHSSSPSPKKEKSSLELRNTDFSNTTTATRDPSPRSTRRPPPLTLYPSALRRLSISSVTSVITQGSLTRSSTMPLPHDSSTTSQSQRLPHESTSYIAPRKPSRMTANISSLVTNTKHAFLASDPYADTTTENTPVTPKTPISMAAAAWKTGISRTLSKARKQSIPKLSAAYAAGAASSRNQSKLSLATETEDAEDIVSLKLRQRASTTPMGAQEAASLRNNGDARAAPESREKERKMSLGIRGLSRQKSIRGRERFLE